MTPRACRLPIGTRRLLLCLASFLLGASNYVHVGAFQYPAPVARASHALRATKKKGGGGKGKPKPVRSGGGFGTAAAVTKASSRWKGTPVESPEIQSLMDYLAYFGAKTSKVTVADFEGLRGLMALQDIKQGEACMEVPFAATVPVGFDESSNRLSEDRLFQPTLEFLRRFFAEDVAKPYFEYLPPLDSRDCTTTDFWPEEVLDMLQFPAIKEDTLERERRRQAKLEFVQQSQGTERATLEHLRWAQFMLASRCFSVQSSTPSKTAKLMIPLLDCCNHDYRSKNMLVGRAAPGGWCKIIAGRDIPAGDQVFVMYGGGMLSSGDFLQEYGFLDDRGSKEADRDAVSRCSDEQLAGFSMTSLDQDREQLAQVAQAEPYSPKALALGFRVKMKEAMTEAPGKS